MSLDEDLRLIPVITEDVTVYGREFVVSGKSQAGKAALMAKCRNKDGTLNGDKLDLEILTQCVKRKHDDKAFDSTYWAEVPSHITSPLISCGISILKFDEDDIKRVRRDPKDSDSTQS